MKRVNYFLCLCTVILTMIMVLSGCSTIVSRSIDDVNDINNIEKNKISEITEQQPAEETAQSSEAMDIIDKLPEEQKYSELDAALAAIRKSNKQGTTQNADGSVIVITQNGSTITGQSKNIPDWSKEKEESSLQRASVIMDYLENELKLPKKENGYNSWACLDPRINAIYDDEDKGVAAGYENNNIYIEEYETEKNDVYSYLFLVRDLPDGDWKVLHQGNSYKNLS